LVNFRHVERIDRTNRAAMMVTGKALPVSELRITEVLTAYAYFQQSTLPKTSAPACTRAEYGNYSDSRSFAGSFG
jgi:hypothetical protein